MTINIIISKIFIDNNYLLKAVIKIQIDPIRKNLISLCAPTLLGIKPSSIFTLRNISKSYLESLIEYWNEYLNPRLYLRIIKEKNDMFLILVYDLEKLKKLLNKLECKNFLINCGYNCENLDCLFNTLTYKLKEDEFPHEIGLILGYPLNDVQAFIKEKGQNYKLAGIWKVYGDVESARENFNNYKACKNLLTSLTSKGVSLENIIDYIKGENNEKNCNCLLDWNWQY